MDVAAPAFATRQQQHARIKRREIGNQRFVVFFEDLRAEWQFQHDVLAGAARPFAPGPVFCRSPP